MDNIIITREANCQHCYKCLRNCPVKSIKFSKEKSSILSEECILCGNCIEVCPQNARTYIKEVDKFREIIKKSFLVSIAPSFFAHFDFPLKIITLLRKLGAVAVQETAVGADIISFNYKRLLEERKKTIITTACPVIVDLAEMYFPEVLDFLAPFLSPMNTHAIFMKKYFGNFPVVYIGPCIAKKKEGRNFIDLVLTYEELEVFLKEEKIDEKNFEESFPTPPYPTRGRIYPVSGGINSSVDGDWEKHIVVEGVENISRVFRNISSMEEGFFIEASSCFGGCIQGPGIRKDLNFLEKRKRILNYMERLKDVKGSLVNPSLLEIDISRKFIPRKREIEVDEESIREVLRSMGKDSPKKELNCGACGYDSCREKAIAVLLGKAEKEMCVTYMIDKATSISNMIIEKFPSIVLIYRDHTLLYLNPKGEELFSGKEALIEYVISEIEEEEGKTLEIHIDGEKHIFFVKTFTLQEKDKVAILIDVTKEKEREEQFRNLKKEAMEKMEEVIGRQMRLAQEIAGILGESIAEAKSQFMKFKKFLEEEDANL